MLGVALVLEPSLDLSVFTPVSQQLTGVNHVLDSDQRELEGLEHVLSVLKSFGRTNPYVVQIGFLVAGPEYYVGLLLEAGNMVHICSKDCAHGIRGCLVLGTLNQWVDLVEWGNRADPVCRKACNEIYHQLCQKGLKCLFTGHPNEQNDGTFLLR